MLERDHPACCARTDVNRFWNFESLGIENRGCPAAVPSDAGSWIDGNAAVTTNYYRFYRENDESEKLVKTFRVLQNR